MACAARIGRSPQERLLCTGPIVHRKQRCPPGHLGYSSTVNAVLGGGCQWETSLHRARGCFANLAAREMPAGSLPRPARFGPSRSQSGCRREWRGARHFFVRASLFFRRAAAIWSSPFRNRLSETPSPGRLRLFANAGLLRVARKWHEENRNCAAGKLHGR